MLMRTSALKSFPASNLQHILGHGPKCPACNAAKLALARTTDLKLLRFSEAAQVCLDDELRFTAIKPRTHKDHCDFVRRLNNFFGETILADIHEGTILSYQQERSKTAGAELINHEVSYLSHVLDKAGLWKELKHKVNRLAVPKSEKGKALSEEEESLLKMCAASNPRWQVAYWGTLLGLNIGLGPGEICNIHVGDIDLKEGFLEIRVDERIGKNEYRAESYPMNPTMRWVCHGLLQRYLKICERQGVEPDCEHYVLPYNAGRNQKSDHKMKGFDLARPQSGWRSAWRALCAKAGLDIRSYDLRHTFLTGLGEDSELAPEVISKLARHGSQRMKKRYMHLRDKTFINVLEKHESTPAPKLIDTPDGIVEVSVLPRRRSAADPKPPAKAGEVLAASQKLNK